MMIHLSRSDLPKYIGLLFYLFISIGTYSQDHTWTSVAENEDVIIRKNILNDTNDLQLHHVVIRIMIKTRISGMAMIRQELIGGRGEVKFRQTEQGEGLFRNGVIKIIWVSFPEKKELELKLSVSSPDPGISFPEANFIYIKDNSKQTFTF